ncbi:hypothetical protein J6590_074573 [Homalodisca vitripennis]|nr:hypothetical protein J6590_074573 [Homalodisca vitripennis]
MSSTKGSDFSSHSTRVGQSQSRQVAVGFLNSIRTHNRCRRQRKCRCLVARWGGLFHLQNIPAAAADYSALSPSTFSTFLCE